MGRVWAVTGSVLGRACAVAGRRVYVKRDDLLQPLSGNKARKLNWLIRELEKHKKLAEPRASPPPLVCFGGNRSNMLPALASLADEFHAPCHFWTNSPFPENVPGVRAHHPPVRERWHALRERARAHARDLSGIFIEGGGHDSRAELGCMELAQELAHQLNSLPTRNPVVVAFACGNGTTWHYTGRHLLRLLDRPVACVGVPVALSATALVSSVKDLSSDYLGHRHHETPVLSAEKDKERCRAWFEATLATTGSVVSPSSPLHAHDSGMCVLEPSRSFSFARPHPRLFQHWLRWRRANPCIPVDLVYFPVLLDALLPAIPCMPPNADIVLYHCGGLDGVHSMLERYSAQLGLSQEQA